jgi:hypothetical protein
MAAIGLDDGFAFGFGGDERFGGHSDLPIVSSYFRITFEQRKDLRRMPVLSTPQRARLAPATPQANIAPATPSGRTTPP